MGSDAASHRRSQRILLSALILVACAALILPGAVSMSDNSKALKDHGCRQTYGWSAIFALSLAVGALATIIAMFTTYAQSPPDIERDPAKPNQLPRALTEDGVFRTFAFVAGLITTILFIWGCAILAQSSCSGFSGLQLYFKFMFFMCIVIIVPCVTCGLIGNFYLSTPEASEFRSLGDSLANDVPTGSTLASQDGNRDTASSSSSFSHAQAEPRHRDLELAVV